VTADEPSATATDRPTDLSARIAADHATLTELLGSF
jgi:hypothetical protein